MLKNGEYLELVRLTQMVEIRGNAEPKDIKRKGELEAKAFKQQIVAARYAARYPALANHLHRKSKPFSKIDEPYT